MAPKKSSKRMEQELEELKTGALVCVKCQLSESRTNVVFGMGSGKSGILFVGEAPGRDEDLQGLPFVGRSGKLLDKLLGEIGLNREDVYIANILKCRPPSNRDPLPAEIEVCEDWLMAQIAILNPAVLCTLGRIALHTLIDPTLTISRSHGRPFVWKGITCMPIYHPAAALRSNAMMESLRDDFVKLKGLLIQKGYLK